jgi:hypothetical protein
LGNFEASIFSSVGASFFGAGSAARKAPETNDVANAHATKYFKKFRINHLLQMVGTKQADKPDPSIRSSPDPQKYKCQ